MVFLCYGIRALLRTLYLRPPKILLFFFVLYIHPSLHFLVLSNDCLAFYSSCFRTQMANENSDRSKSLNPSQNKNLFQDENFVHSFLYLHPSENPATPLVSPVLDSTNYHFWIRSVLTALSAKNKLEFVKCVVPRPSEIDSSSSSSTRCNNMVASWLVHPVSVHIR